MKKIAKKSWISAKSLKSLKSENLRAVSGGTSTDASGLNAPAGGGNG